MVFDSNNLILTDIDNVVHLTGTPGAQSPETAVFAPRKYYGLVIQISGIVQYDIADSLSITLSPGSVLYLQKGQPYRVINHTPSDILVECVNFHLLSDPAVSAFSCKPQNFPKWQKMFSELYARWTNQEPGYYADCRAIVYRLLAMLDKQQSSQYVPPSRLRTIYDASSYMRQNLHDPTLSIEGAAQMHNMSTAYFRKQFHTVFGLAPKQYLISLRISQAKTLLTTTNLTVSQIAESVGFESIYHFSKTFKQITGTSPSMYRSESFLI